MKVLSLSGWDKLCPVWSSELGNQGDSPVHTAADTTVDTANCSGWELAFCQKLSFNLAHGQNYMVVFYIRQKRMHKGILESRKYNWITCMAHWLYFNTMMSIKDLK